MSYGYILYGIRNIMPHILSYYTYLADFEGN